MSKIHLDQELVKPEICVSRSSPSLDHRMKSFQREEEVSDVFAGHNQVLREIFFRQRLTDA